MVAADSCRSRQFRMTSRRLKALCCELDVPVPSLGHWRKNPERQERDKHPLPQGRLGNERIWVPSFTRAPWLGQTRRRWPMRAARMTACGERLRLWRRPVRTDAASLLLSEKVVASVAVTDDNVPRALSILHALCNAAEGAGYSISTRSTPAALVVAGVQVPFGLIENQRGLELVLGDNIGEGQRLWTDMATEPLEDRAPDIMAAARIHAEAIGRRDQAIADRTASRRTEELERSLFGKRLTFLMESADRLVEADKVQRLADHLRSTDDGSSLRCPKSCAGPDAYVVQLRARCSAVNVDREAGDWRIW